MMVKFPLDDLGLKAGFFIMANDKPKKQRTPRTTESITAGALSLTLSDRITLCKKLKEGIQHELRVLEANAKNAAEAAKDL